MQTHQRHMLVRIFELVDLITITYCYIIMYTVAVTGKWKIPQLSMAMSITDMILLIALIASWHTLFTYFGLYKSRRLDTLMSEIKDVVCATVLCVLVAYGMTALLQKRDLNITVILQFWAMITSVMVICRILLRSFLASVRKNNMNLRYILIIGTNKRAHEFAHYIIAKKQLGFRLVGFVDDRWHGNVTFPDQKFQLVCSFAEVSDYIRRNIVDEMYMTLPLNSFYPVASRLAELCQEHGIIMRYNTALFSLERASNTADDIEPYTMVSHYFTSMTGWRFVLKRMFDVSVATVLIVTLIPIFIGVGILIKLTSPGQVLFKQQRIGFNKRVFYLYKFRTMVNNAQDLLKDLEHKNEANGPVFKIKDDPRITTIGKILRKTSIDELPQLFNVLRGEMSLVGPRPLPLRDYNGFSSDSHRRRLSVLPGITCIWQSSGRSNISFERWMEMDLEYVDKWSLSLDFKILARTVVAVVRGTGAA
ncbi:MAG: sugar transferase [Chitinivibrionales bacterium]|nr:sugar transferase [Chitinivibrionales bacterium]